MANFSQNLGTSGLGTLSFVVPAAGTYYLSGSISLPMLSQDVSQPAPPSSVTATGSSPNYQSIVSAVLVVINLNGSPVYTGIAGATGFQAVVACAAADTLAFVYSSSAAPDQGLNAIKSTISISS